MSGFTNNPVALRRFRLEAQRTANTREQADLRNKLFFSPYPHHKTEEGQKMILDLLASSERVGLQIKVELEALNKPQDAEVTDEADEDGAVWPWRRQDDEAVERTLTRRDEDCW